MVDARIAVCKLNSVLISVVLRKNCSFDLQKFHAESSFKSVISVSVGTEKRFPSFDTFLVEGLVARVAWAERHSQPSKLLHVQDVAALEVQYHRGQISCKKNL